MNLSARSLRRIPPGLWLGASPVKSTLRAAVVSGAGRTWPALPPAYSAGYCSPPRAFRELLTLPEANLHIIPNSISTEEAVFIEPLAAACEILDQVRIPQGSNLAVLGDGKLGLLIAQVLKAARMRVHLYGRHKEKLRLAGRAGVDTAVVGKKLPQSAYDWIVDQPVQRKD